MRAPSRLVRSVAVLLALCASGSLLAESSPWPQVPFKYFARGYPLARVMQDFTHAFGIGLDLSPKVDGEVVGDYSAPTPAEFLNALASRYGFNWYYQDGTLHVTKAIEWITRPLHVGTVGANIGTLREELTHLGVFDPRFGWAEFPERGIVLVSGPESYVQELSSIISTLGTVPSDGRQIRLFRLQYARADDYMFSYQGQQVVTPGVATLLRNLAAGSIAVESAGPSTGPLSVAPSTLAVPMPGLPIQAALTGQPPHAAPAGAAALDPPAPADAHPQPDAGGGAKVHAGLDILTPVIEADPRLNAVIVYDAPEKMPIYEALIRQLDEGRPQIQIEAMIVDVDTDAVDTLGVAWEARAGSATVGFGERGGSNQATVLSINSDSFLARVHALATKGQARVLGRPSVLTIDNLVAVLSLSETFYARVSTGGGGRGNGGGVAQGGLVPITTGTMLRVIPRLVQEAAGRDVSLAVSIEDGQLHYDEDRDGQGAPPSVIESSINTQAVIREDDSLLIGGYFMDSDVNEQHRVPGLSRIPLLGAMFRDSHTEHHRSERLFLIRPHVVTVSAAAFPAAEVPKAQ